MPQVLFVIVVGCIVIIGAAFAFYADIKRRNKLSLWALQNGLEFSSGKATDEVYEFGDFDCLNRGSDRYAYNMISGTLHGIKFIGFDYHYQTGSGKNRQQHFFSAVILKSPILLKPLLIRPENLLDKVGAALGFDDINFESAEFSRKFFVKSPDKRWAYDIIHPRMMEYLLASPVFSIQFGLAYVIAWRDRRFECADFEAAAQIVKGIFDRIPEYVVQKQQGG